MAEEVVPASFMFVNVTFNAPHIPNSQPRPNPRERVSRPIFCARRNGLKLGRATYWGLLAGVPLYFAEKMPPGVH